MCEKKRGFRIIGNLKNTDKFMKDSFRGGEYPGMIDDTIDDMIKKISELFV